MTSGTGLEPATASCAAPRAAPADRPTNVLIVGVGGQGVIMISKVLALLCQQQNLDVKQSEVHGMSKRGGSVFSHLRFGSKVYSPTIPMGEADVLVALEWAEGLRWLPYLNPDHGTFVVDTQQLIPPFACRSRKIGALTNYVRHTVAEVVEKVPNCFAANATSIATGLGNPRAANTVLLGMLSTTLDFPEQEWRDLIEQLVPPKTRAINLQAFEQGREWVRHHDPEDAPREAVIPPAAVEEIVAFRRGLPQINAAWCKGCDICVKFCPERCLALDGNQIAVLTDGQACTRCCICERLCPDFAITLDPVDPAIPVSP